MLDWELTRKNYVNWLSFADLRKKISREIKYDELSIWWISKLMAKDNVNEQIWFKNLNSKLHSKKTINEKKINYFFLFLKCILNFFFKIISILMIKIFIKQKNINKLTKYRDAYYTVFSNYKYYKGHFIDRQYGLINNIKNYNKINIIELPENLDLLKNFFSIKHKVKLLKNEFIIMNSRISFIEILKVYFKFIFLLSSWLWCFL